MKIQLSNGKTLRCENQPFSSGAEGECYLTSDGSSVVKLYWPTESGQARRRTLDKIVEDYGSAVTGNAEAASLFAWPNGIVVKQDGVDRLGITMPRVPGRKLLEHVKPKFWLERMKSHDRGPGWHKRISVSYRLARAVSMMHNTGLCHSDLSANNALVDMNSAKTTVLIDCDGIVVPDIHPPRVLGTPWYMAPEIVIGNGAVLPTIKSDLHALAVLIYQTFLLHHPLMGPKVHNATTAEEEDLLAQGKGALYIEHPTDRSNRPQDLRVTTDLLTPRMKKLFERAFVEGLHEPNRRPLASHWEDALKRMADRTVQCQNGDCLMKAFVIHEHHQPECPWCGAPYRDPAGRFPLLTLYRPSGRPGGFVPDDWDIVGYNDRSLFEHHRDPSGRPAMSGATTKIAYLSFRDGEWYLHNLSEQEMRLLNGGTRPIARNESQALREGMKLLLGPMGKARALFVRFVNT